ncbi:MAG: zf-HC2 domain-containing protein, partial [Candidatus Hodarchaeales archaeon]
MSRCQDQKIGMLIEEYLLDTLDDDDRELFELHLLNCDRCANVVEQYYKLADHIVHSSTIHDEIERMDKILNGNQEDESQSIASPKPIKHRKVIFAWTSIAAAAILIFLILKPWNIRIDTTDQAFAQENRVAILPFNLIQPDTNYTWLGNATSNLIITSLSQSDALPVVSNKVIDDVLLYLDISSDTILDINIVADVAAKAKAKWVVSGSIIQIYPSIAMNIIILDVNTKDTVTQQMISAGP